VDGTAATEPDGVGEPLCADVVEQLTDYLDGALDPADVARIRGHLRGCAGCDTYLDQLRFTVRVVSTLPTEHLPAEVGEYLRSLYREGGRP
jgi:anti-sigma factor RsiW